MPVNGSWMDGADAAYKSIQKWAKRFDRRFDKIVIVDTYGEYARILNQDN